jgi:hypothetical protein
VRADGPDRRDAIRRQSLHGADRLAVVAELRVVVVLDDERVGLAGPRDQGVPAFRCQHHSGRPLVSGRRDDGPGTAGGERTDVEAVLVDGYGHGHHAGPASHGNRCVVAVARILERDHADAGPAQGAQRQPEPFGEPAAHHDPLGAGRHRSHRRR